MRHTFTSTYTTLDVAESSFNDIKKRLAKAEVLNDYLTEDRQHGAMILFGTVGLVIDKETTRKSMKGCCKYHASGGPAGTACGDYTYTEIR